MIIKCDGFILKQTRAKVMPICIMRHVIPLTCLDNFNIFASDCVNLSMGDGLVLVLDSEGKVAEGIKLAIDT